MTLISWNNCFLAATFTLYLINIHISYSYKLSHFIDRGSFTDVMQSKKIHNRFANIMLARKIDDEEAALKTKSERKSPNRKNKKVSSTLENNNNADDETNKENFPGQVSSPSPDLNLIAEDLPAPEAAIDPSLSEMFVEESTGMVTPTTENIFNNAGDDYALRSAESIKVPKSDPLNQSRVPPEVVFFGDPRKPPPVEAAREVKYHGSLLFWARHATVAPVTSTDRLETVFPKGRLHPQASKYRLDPLTITYEKILNGFEAVQDDLQQSKDFIISNIDLVPSRMFLRALTAQKLSLQSKNDIEGMLRLKELRSKYILAQDQIFFPLNIEVMKAETRVMTYLARDELRSFAKGWDSVEASLHFTTLLAARLTWDDKVKEVLANIKSKMDRTVGYMLDKIRDQLMSREFRKPAITAEVYLNASMKIKDTMPEFYSKIKAEVKVIHETYFLTEEEDIKNYILKEFCPRVRISVEDLKEKLKILDASLAAVQGVDYKKLRLRVRRIFETLCTEEEIALTDKWYKDYFANGYGFETYEPDVVPTLIRTQARFRETKNAFVDFGVQILQMGTKYSNAFSGSRPKGSEVGNWLERDPEWFSKTPSTYEERILEFKQAYMKQTQERKKAEGVLDGIVIDRMAVQDRELGRKLDLVMQFNDEDEDVDDTIPDI